MLSSSELTQVIKYMAGNLYTTSSKLLWDGTRTETTPVQSSLIQEYLINVNRFLFSGGIRVDIHDLPEDDECQIFLNRCLEYNELNSILENLWYLAAITGEVLVVARPFQNKYSFEFFEKGDYEVKFTGRQIKAINIQKTIHVDGKEYIYKLDVNPLAYVDYDLVEKNKVGSRFDWSKYSKVVPHNYGLVPGSLLKNNAKISCSRGYTDFNYAAIKLAISCARMERGLDEDVEFFSTPLFNSPDPMGTRKALQKKEQVLQKLPDIDGGSTDLLQPDPIDEDVTQYWKDKRSNFLKIMGVSNPYELKVTQLSNAALETLNFSLISKAESKWETLISVGLEPFLTKLIKMAYKDKFCVVPSALLKKTKCVTVSRLKPYFPQTMQELSLGLQVANQMFDLGIQPAQALKQTVFNYMSLEDINEMMDTNRSMGYD